MKCGPLLEDAAAGTPQRFAWCRASDPSVPDEPECWPGPLRWQPPSYQVQTKRGVVNSTGPIPGYDVKRPVGIPPEVQDEIRARDLARVRGLALVGERQDHSDLMRLKMAALLAVLDDRTNTNQEDWELAGVLKATSDATMAYAADVVVAEAQRRERET